MSGEVAWTRQDAEQKDTEKVRLWLNNKTDKCSSRSSKVSEAESSQSKSKKEESSSSLPPMKIMTEEASPTWLAKPPREEQSGEDDDDGFLYIGEPPFSSDEDIELPPGFADLLKRYPDSSMLRRRTNIPPPSPRSDGDSSEVNRYRPFRRFARSPTPQKKYSVVRSICFSMAVLNQIGNIWA